MELNGKQLNLVVRIIDAVLVLIILTIIFTVYFKYKLFAPSVLYFDTLGYSKDKTDSMKLTFLVISYFSLIKISFSKIFYSIVFIYLRGIVRSIQKGELFNENISNKLRKLVMILLVASLMIFISTLLIVRFGKLNNEKSPEIIISSITIGVQVFETFLMPALIIFCIAEAFAFAYKIKQENDLTI